MSNSTLKTIDSNIEHLLDLQILDRQIIDSIDLEPIKVKLMDAIAAFCNL